MRTNYMMTVDDVMEELGVKRSKACTGFLTDPAWIKDSVGL